MSFHKFYRKLDNLTEKNSKPEANINVIFRLS